MEKIHFKGFVCNIQFAQYTNERTAILLQDAKDGGPVATASVNLPDHPMHENEVAIKDYSENEGMLQTLIDADIVSEPHSFAQSGFVTIPICKLLVDPS